MEALKIRRYHLSYDVDTKKYPDTEKVKEWIVANLLFEGAYNLTSPVASTIIFDDSADPARPKFWFGILKNMRHVIHYHISSTRHYTNGTFVEDTFPNKSIVANFKNLLTKVKKDINKYANQI